MARILKEEEYTQRRNEILNAAQKFVYTIGYEQMSIQNLLDDLQISKGAFYHYFDSKQALLEALVDRTTKAAISILLPVIKDPDLTALEKLHHFFDTAVRWKTEQKSFFIGLLRVWYQDENAIVRQKVTAAGLTQIKPLLAQIIQQGADEGIFTATHPNLTADLVMALFQGMSENLAGLFLMENPGKEILDRIKNTITAYTDALERVLRAPCGSIHLMDTSTLEEWFVKKG